MLFVCLQGSILNEIGQHANIRPEHFCNEVAKGLEAQNKFEHTVKFGNIICIESSHFVIYQTKSLFIDQYTTSYTSFSKASAKNGAIKKLLKMLPPDYLSLTRKSTNWIQLIRNPDSG